MSGEKQQVKEERGFKCGEHETGTIAMSPGPNFARGRGVKGREAEAENIGRKDCAWRLALWLSTYVRISTSVCIYGCMCINIKIDGKTDGKTDRYKFCLPYLQDWESHCFLGCHRDYDCCRNCLY